MASTNKTTNYELSQFQSSDIPAWLTDYNGDMQKIDAGIHAAKTQAQSAANGVSSLQTAVSGKQDTLTFDTTPLSGSNNPVTSGGIYNALQNVGVQTDAVPTEGSTKAVQSGGVYSALQGKQDTLNSTSYTLTNASGISGDANSKAYVYGDVCTLKMKRVQGISSSAWTSDDFSSGVIIRTVSGNIFNLTESTLASQLGQSYKTNSIGSAMVKGTYNSAATLILANIVVFFDGTNTNFALIVGSGQMSNWSAVHCYMNLADLATGSDGASQSMGGVFTFLISSLS